MKWKQEFWHFNSYTCSEPLKLWQQLIVSAQTLNQSSGLYWQMGFDRFIHLIQTDENLIRRFDGIYKSFLWQAATLSVFAWCFPLFWSGTILISPWYFFSIFVIHVLFLVSIQKFFSLKNSKNFGQINAESDEYDFDISRMHTNDHAHFSTIEAKLLKLTTMLFFESLHRPNFAMACAQFEDEATMIKKLPQLASHPFWIEFFRLKAFWLEKGTPHESALIQFISILHQIRTHHIEKKIESYKRKTSACLTLFILPLYFALVGGTLWIQLRNSMEWL